MASLGKEKLSEYESLRQRNVDNNREILRYLNLQEVVELESDGSTGVNDFANDTGNPRPKKKYRKSPLPPTRPKSQRLREREKRLQEGQRNEPVIPPDYYDQFELPTRRIPRNSPTLQASDSPRLQQNRHHFLHHHHRQSDRVNINNSNNNRDEGVEIIGKKYMIITFLLILIATSEWYKSEACCRRTVSRMIFNGVLTILVVNLINILFFSKRKR